MSDLPKCPKCGSAYTYEDGNMFICPECAHEWSKEATAEAADEGLVVKDAHRSLRPDAVVSVERPLYPLPGCFGLPGWRP